MSADDLGLGAFQYTADDMNRAMDEGFEGGTRAEKKCAAAIMDQLLALIDGLTMNELDHFLAQAPIAARVMMRVREYIAEADAAKGKK